MPIINQFQLISAYNNHTGKGDLFKDTFLRSRENISIKLGSVFSFDFNQNFTACN